MVKKRKRTGNGSEGEGDGSKEATDKGSEGSEMEKQIAADAVALNVLVGLIPEEHYKAPDPDKKLMMSSKYMKKDKSNVGHHWPIMCSPFLQALTSIIPILWAGGESEDSGSREASAQEGQILGWR
jgi:hypothetical protein